MTRTHRSLHRILWPILALVVVLGVVLALLLVVALSRIVLEPLAKVTRHAVAMGDGTDSPPLNVPGHDEIALLAREIDRMVERVAESRRQLVDQSFNGSGEIWHHPCVAQARSPAQTRPGTLYLAVWKFCGGISLRSSEPRDLESWHAGKSSREALHLIRQFIIYAPRRFIHRRSNQVLQHLLIFSGKNLRLDFHVQHLLLAVHLHCDHSTAG